jgi:hypothetical protein
MVEHDYRKFKHGLGLDTSRAAPSSAGTATSHHRRPRPGVLYLDPQRPKSPCAGMILYQVLHELQIVLALILGACLCRSKIGFCVVSCVFLELRRLARTR